MFEKTRDHKKICSKSAPCSRGGVPGPRSRFSIYCGPEDEKVAAHCFGKILGLKKIFFLTPPKSYSLQLNLLFSFHPKLLLKLNYFQCQPEQEL